MRGGKKEKERGRGKEKETYLFGKQSVCKNPQYTAEKILTL